jgi:hypothetical protein
VAKVSRTGGRSGARVAQPPSQAAPPTIASLGVHARLVRVDPERERAFADLLVGYHQVCRDWERLVQQAIQLLGADFLPDQPTERPVAPTVKE